MRVPVLFIGGGPLDGLLGVAKGSFPEEVRGSTTDPEPAACRLEPNERRPYEAKAHRHVVYRRHEIGVSPGHVALLEGRRVRHGQIFYLLDGSEARLVSMPVQEYENRIRALVSDVVSTLEEQNGQESD